MVRLCHTVAIVLTGIVLFGVLPGPASASAKFIGVATEGPAVSGGSREIVYQPQPGVVRVRDTRTGKSTDRQISAGCSLVNAAFEEMLLECRDGTHSTPAVMPIVGGGLRLFPPPNGPSDVETSFTKIGRYWIEGVAYGDRSKSLVEVNWRTGRTGAQGFGDPARNLD